MDGTKSTDTGDQVALFESLTYMQRYYILNKEEVKRKAKVYRDKYKAIKYQREQEYKKLKKQAIEELLKFESI